ncbi:hypothetical protein UFOVP190_135 [uncultured Caudovirales phage]|uniref:Uncharacterized protein n=1 Tax=uncultured Caudovirales phage TaxID=2100421 RepID=A0A6J7WKC5_9CAUD|nr:hypothetical protein UFOVP190_135 [uncultured Caudovirales phage]
MGGQSHKTSGGNTRSQTTGWGYNPICRVATPCIVKRIDETWEPPRPVPLTGTFFVMQQTQCALLYPLEE